MAKAFVLSSSAAGEASVSNEITRALIAKLTERDPSVEIVTRDIGAAPVPHLTAAHLPGLAGKTESPEAAETAALSDVLVEELRAADIVVIGSPMYNFGISSTLKAWFDHILRAGVTFRYTAEGPVGLLTGKRAIVVESRGGFYSAGPGAASDSQEPHLRNLLGFIGITDVTFIRAEKLAISPEERAAGIAAAMGEVHALSASDFRLAA